MRASGIGSLPGDSAQAYTEAVRWVWGELGEPPGLPHVPELPGRGAHASMIGRTLAVVAELDADLQPAGWRLTGSSGSPGVDQRRTRSLLAQDLDSVEELTQEYAGPVKAQITGPWTLAASVERPRGDKVLADHGARRELAQALAEGVRDHVRDLRRRLPGADRLLVQLDEPALPAVLAGKVPTASGFGRHRTVHPPEASETLGWVLRALVEEGAEPWVHCCAPETPISLITGALRDASAAAESPRGGIAVDLDLASAADHDSLAEALEAGWGVGLGVVPSLPPEHLVTDTQVVERVERWLDMLGLDLAEVGERLVVTPSCGLAGAGADWARQAMTLARTTASALS